MGLAAAHLNRGDADEAVRALDRGLRLADDASREDLHAFRGLALQLAGRGSESVRSLKAAAGHRLALAMLGEACVPIEEK